MKEKKLRRMKFKSLENSGCVIEIFFAGVLVIASLSKCISRISNMYFPLLKKYCQFNRPMSTAEKTGPNFRSRK